MLKRARPVSPSLFPFETDINIAPYNEYTVASRETKRHGHVYHSTSCLAKRRRSSSEVMENDDQQHHSTNYPSHDMKRRRTVAPSLDGKSRGWSLPSPPDTESSSGSSGYLIENGYDERYFDHDAEWDIDDGGCKEEEWNASASEYRDANTLLHDLHAQSRICNPSPITHDYQLHQQRLLPSPSLLDSGYRPREIADPDIITTECQLVRDRYEEQNRLLRTLFLGRRRNLDEMNIIP